MMTPKELLHGSAAAATRSAAPAPTLRHEPVSLPLRGPAEAYTGMSTNTLYRLHAKGEVSLFKCGRRTLLDTASWRAFQARAPRLAPRPRRHRVSKISGPPTSATCWRRAEAN
jgi:hypothetical protein